MKRINILSFGPIVKETVEPARRQEQRDSRMMTKDNSSIANMPQEPINMQFNSGFQVERLRFCENEE